MSLRSQLVSRIADRFTSDQRQQQLRGRAEKVRSAARERHRVHYFHQASDPYSSLAAQILPLLVARYDIDVEAHLTSPSPDWAAPDRSRLEAWARQDAARLAQRAGLSFSYRDAAPDPDAIARAEGALAHAIHAGRFIEDAGAISIALWAGGDIRADVADVSSLTAQGDALRARFGHYSGGMLYYAGEWYWGIDRLHYLEERLAALGARRPASPVGPIYPPEGSTRATGQLAATIPGQDLHFYLSFRSPYTWIAADRVRALADAHGLALRLRFVLPMVMRGLPVPRAKRTYITLDAAREARRAGVPFGRIADPVGRPVERGYSLLPWAVSEGRGYAFCHAFMRAVWSRGVDAGCDRGLRAIVESAGLDWTVARSHAGKEAWRLEAEANRRELLELGLWGVPSFRFGKTIAWGQDRLWVIEDAIRNEIEHAGRG